MQTELELPDFEVPGQTKLFDLMDWMNANDPRVRTPLRQVVAEGMPGYLLKHMQSVAIKRQFEAIVPFVRQALTDKKAGYLLRVNLYAQDTGTLFSPAGAIVSAVGIGVEPLDALAEAYRNPSIRAPRPEGLQDVSAYIWINQRKMADGRMALVATHIPSDLGRAFESKARSEAERRNLINATYVTPGPERYTRVQMAQFWDGVYNERQAAIADAARRQEIAGLNQRFKKAEDRFNTAYGAYQRLERQMAEHARETAVLDAIDGVLSLVKGGLELQAKNAVKKSSAPDPTKATTPPPINNQTISYLLETREQTLNGIKQTVRVEVQTSYADLKKSNSELQAGWQQSGVPVPTPPELQVQID